MADENAAENNVAGNSIVLNNGAATGESSVDVMDEADHICLKVSGRDNFVVQFKMKKHIQLKKLMNAYCKRADIDVNSVRFRLHGSTICTTDTPLSLNIEEGDTIEVY